MRTVHLLALVCGLSLFSAFTAEAKPVQHVIVISVDGLGRELFEKSTAHRLRRLVREGAIAPVARTVDPPLTVPSHVSMLTGVKPEQHKILQNDLDPSLQTVQVPTIFDLVKQNGLTSVAVFGKEKLSHVFNTGAATRIHQPSWPLIGDFAGRFPSLIESHAIEEMRKNKPSLLFVHYALPDTMGHWFKWGAWPQRASIRLVDGSIGRIVDQAKKTYKGESFAVIVTADHGGNRGAHGQKDELGNYRSEKTDLYIPFIVYGAKLKDGIEVVNVYDTAPTVASLLGLEVPQDWEWQGQAVVQ